MNRAMPLKGLTVLVTGGGRGVGRACVASCASAGARVIAVARTRADLESLRAEIGGEVETHAADVTDPQFYRDLESRTDIDVLVNNAGTNRLQDLADVDDETLDLLIALNVRSAFKVSQSVAKSMIGTRRGGSIFRCARRRLL